MPTLFIIAGPNGSGKSFFSKLLLQPLTSTETISFDFDVVKDNFWKMFDYDPLVEDGVIEKSISEFDREIFNSIELQKDFSFQSNFHDPVIFETIEKFKSKGFFTHLIYLYVDQINKLEERVKFRYEFKYLHFVDKNTIKSRYKKGLKLLNENHHRFDELSIFDNSSHYTISKDKNLPELIFRRKKETKHSQLNNTQLKIISDLPFIFEQ